jgi:hypothetical protein
MCKIWSTALDDVVKFSFQKVNKKYVKSFKMCWRRMAIILVDRVRIE